MRKADHTLNCSSRTVDNRPRKWFSSLSGMRDTTSGVPHPVEKRHWCAVAGIVGGCQDVQGAGAQCYMKKDWGNWIFSALKSEGGDWFTVYWCLVGECKEDRTRLIWKVRSGKTRSNGQKLEARTLKRKIKEKNLFTMKVVKHCSKGPKRPWDLYLGDIQNATSTAPNNLLWLDLLEQEAGLETSGGPLQPMWLINRNKLSSPLTAEVNEIKLL